MTACIQNRMTVPVFFFVFLLRTPQSTVLSFVCASSGMKQKRHQNTRSSLQLNYSMNGTELRILPLVKKLELATTDGFSASNIHSLIIRRGYPSLTFICWLFLFLKCKRSLFLFGCITPAHTATFLLNKIGYTNI